MQTHDPSKMRTTVETGIGWKIIDVNSYEGAYEEKELITMYRSNAIIQNAYNIWE